METGIRRYSAGDGEDQAISGFGTRKGLQPLMAGGMIARKNEAAMVGTASDINRGMARKVPARRGWHHIQSNTMVFLP
jgi:hypothetical protein